MKALRRGLSSDQIAAYSRAITARLLSMPEVTAGPVLVYVAFRKEVRTRPLISALLGQGVTVAVPFMDGANLRARRLDSLEDLMAGDMGIETSVGPDIQVDSCITPGLAFSEAGGRLGFGAGYYDRFFAEHPRVFAIGVCLEEQIGPVPQAPHDHVMDAVVTPRRLLRPAPSRHAALDGP